MTTAALVVAGIGLAGAATASADASGDAYLATIEANGIPIYGEDYVITLGQEVCRTARRYPSMQVVDLAMGSVTSEYEPRPYDYSQVRRSS